MLSIGTDNMFYLAKFQSLHTFCSEHKCLEKILLTHQTESFCQTFWLIHFGAKKVFFPGIFGSLSIKYEIF